VNSWVDLLVIDLSGEPIYLGETIRWRNAFKDFDENAVTPTTQSVSVKNPSGTEIHSDSSPNYDAGDEKYYTDVAIPADGVAGNYVIRWTATYGSVVWKGKKKFSVEEFN